MRELPCTQACLRGLLRQEALDDKCPNVDVHRAAANYRGALRHPLTADELCALVIKQLAMSPDLDCKCLDRYGLFGRHGVLFKIMLTGYGYRFVAKGVRACDRGVLAKEKEIYDAAYNAQGHILPVCLGVIELDKAIPLHSYVLVRHMMLLSDAGTDVFRAKEKHLLPHDIDIEHEKQRTWDELYEEGVENHDVRSPNMAWNDEVRRVMHFDLYRATLVSSKKKKHQQKRNRREWAAKMVDWRKSVSEKLDDKQPATAKRDLDNYQDDDADQGDNIPSETAEKKAATKRMKTT